MDKKPKVEATVARMQMWQELIANSTADERAELIGFERRWATMNRKQRREAESRIRRMARGA